MPLLCVPPLPSQATKQANPPSSHAANSKAGSTLTGDAAHPAHGVHWVDTQLYFGLGPADQPEKGVTEAAWRAFLDTEVTPRFPAGLSVIDVYGQWQGKEEKAPERIRSKMLVIDYPSTPAKQRQRSRPFVPPGSR